LPFSIPFLNVIEKSPDVSINVSKLASIKLCAFTLIDCETSDLKFGFELKLWKQFKVLPSEQYQP